MNSTSVERAIERALRPYERYFPEVSAGWIARRCADEAAHALAGNGVLVETLKEARARCDTDQDPHVRLSNVRIALDAAITCTQGDSNSLSKAWNELRRAEEEYARTQSSQATGAPPNVLERAWDWEVSPCVNSLGNVTSWDINVRAEPGARGVAVIAHIYSGEAVARAILAACQTTTEHPLVTMMRLDHELGLDVEEGGQ